jgi:hypothetical protein
MKYWLSSSRAVENVPLRNDRLWYIKYILCLKSNEELCGTTRVDFLQGFDLVLRNI